MKKDVCLIGEMHAPENEPNYTISTRSLGVAIIASCLREKGMSVDIIDPILHRYTIDQCYELIQSNEYKYFGFSVMLNFHYSKALIKKLRQMGYTQHFTMGGVFVTTNVSYILAHNQDMGIDSVILGEGEKTIVELFSCLDNNGDWKSLESIAYRENGKVIINPRRKRITNLDDIPFPAMDDVSFCIEQHMPISIYSSRGCPGTCLYCGSNNLLNDKNNNWIYRSADNVIQELKILKQQYNVSKISFVDDNFVGTLDAGVERALEICERIIEEKLDIEFFLECRPDALNEKLTKALHDAGCRSIFIGIESASDDRLKEIGRPTLSAEKNQFAIDLLNANRIEPMIGFMMFTPDTTMQDIKMNIDFFEKFVKERFVGNYKTQGIISLVFSELLAISGTLTRKHLEKQDRIIEKNATYLPCDGNVYILLSIIRDHDILPFMLSIENKIRRHWINVYLPKHIQKIAQLKYYEKDIVLSSITLFRDIIESIQQGNLSTVTKRIIAFKRDIIRYSNEAIRNIQQILEEGV